MIYIVNKKPYSFYYQELKTLYELYSGLSDENFVSTLPNIIHFACIVSYIKELKNEQTLSDEGIIHQLVHLLNGNDTSITLQEIRDEFDKLLKLD